MSVQSPPSLRTTPLRIRRSKLDPPHVTGPFIRRPAIEARLDQAMTRALTLIIAPAGHGKTRTLIEWLNARDHAIAWMTIDSQDQTLTRFATHVAAALDQLIPGLAPEFYAYLNVPSRLQAYDLGEVLGDALYDLERDIVLVLDDLHAASGRDIVAFVEGLIHAGPRHLHLIISTRMRPAMALTRLRAAGQVAEMLGADLRLSPHETVAFLNQELGSPVDEPMAARLSAMVGGWPAAIRLLAIGLTAGGELTAESRFDVSQELTLAYVSEEVLSQLPAASRSLLLRASLFDRFNPSLLRALATDGTSREKRGVHLDDLRMLDVFREVPGLSETWYAFHPLFQTAFRHELERTSGNDVIVALHRTAAQWFAAAGLTLEAVRHLVAVDDLAAAAALIESRITAAFAAEDWQSVSAWLRLIPTEEIRRRPELLLASVWVAYLNGRSVRIADVWTAIQDEQFQAVITAAQRAELALIAEPVGIDPTRWIAIAEQAIAQIDPQRRYRYGYAHLALGMALSEAGRSDEALARLAAFTAHESARIDAASIRGYFGRALVLWQTGRLSQCAQTAADLLQLAKANTLPVSAGWGAVLLGQVAHERGQLTAATRHLTPVFVQAEQLHFEGVRESFFIQILMYEAEGLTNEAKQAIARIRDLAIATETPHQLELVDAITARAALIRGELAAAQHWLESSRPDLDRNSFMNFEHPSLTRAKVLVAVATPASLEEAQALLAAFTTRARAFNYPLMVLESLAVSALLHEALSEPTIAADLLRESLAIASGESLVQRYVYLGAPLVPILHRLLDESPFSYAGAVLAAIEAKETRRPLTTSHATNSATVPDHALSPREFEVLQAVARNLTNGEIGDELFISPMTVKHHVTHVCTKLEVSGRRSAVARARELGILP